MIYDKLLDECIYGILLREGKIHFNKLWKQLNEKFRPTIRRRLSIHLKLNEEQGIIDRDKFSHGRHRNLWLSEEAKIQMKLGIFEGIESKRESKSQKKETIREQLKKIIIVMFISAASGTRYFKKSEEPRPGQLVIEKGGKETHYQLEMKQGIGVDDFSLPTRHGITYGALKEIGIDKKDLEEYFKHICHAFPQIFRLIDIENGKIRYGINDTTLHDYILECEIMLSWSISRMENSWRYRKPRRSEGEKIKSS